MSYIVHYHIEVKEYFLDNNCVKYFTIRNCKSMYLHENLWKYPHLKYYIYIYI